MEHRDIMGRRNSSDEFFDWIMGVLGGSVIGVLFGFVIAIILIFLIGLWIS